MRQIHCHIQLVIAQKYTYMHELPIVILSKELKYSLALQKVKTLEKAVELLPKLTAEPDQQKADKIKELSLKYKSFQQMVSLKFNQLNGGSFSQMQKNSGQQQNCPKVLVSIPAYQILAQNGIIEIAGAKGSGKTCLLLHYAQQFIQMYSETNSQISVTILNCAGGITQKRMQRLQHYKDQKKAQIEYFDIGNADDAYMITEQILKHTLEGNKNKKILIVIDSLVTLLLPREKSKPVVSRLMKNFKYIAQHCLCVAIFTNFIQHKFQIGHEELYNHASYHAQITGQYLTCKLYTQKPDKNCPNYFKMASIKGNKVRAQFKINEHGVDKMQMCP